MTLPDELATKSVALQGLPALEYLLYGDGADVLTKDDRIVDGTEPLPRIDSQGAFRCGFALSIATNISRIARNVVEGWREGTTYEKAFLGPVPDSRLYHTPKEVTLDLFKSFASGIELVRHEKLGKPLGARSEDAKPELAAFRRSGLTLANAAGNLEGVRILFVQGGFAQVVAQESPAAEDFDPVRSQPRHRGLARHRPAVRRSGGGRYSSRQDRGRARRIEECRADRGRHDLARCRPQPRIQRD